MTPFGPNPDTLLPLDPMIDFKQIMKLQPWLKPGHRHQPRLSLAGLMSISTRSSVVKNNLHLLLLSSNAKYTLTLHKHLLQKRFARSISGHQETIAHFQDLTVCSIRFRP